MRNLFIYFSLAAVLLSVTVISGCSYLSNFKTSAKPTEYRCTMAGEPDPTTSEDFYQRAIKHSQQNKSEVTGDYEECGMTALNESLRLDPNNVKALLMRGYGYRQKQKYDLALADAEKLLQIDPKNADGYALRGSIFDLQGASEKAIQDQTKTIELTPKENPELHYLYANRGNYYFKKGDYQSAAQDFSEAIRLKPEYKFHYAKRAETYRKLGKNELAIADEQKAEQNTGSKNSDENLNDQAVNLAKPAYPAAARAVRANGEVRVQVTIDENGKVISAVAISGHPLLKSSAESAARASTFKLKERKTGIVVFNFAVE